MTGGLLPESTHSVYSPSVSELYFSKMASSFIILFDTIRLLSSDNPGGLTAFASILNGENAWKLSLVNRGMNS